MDIAVQLRSNYHLRFLCHYGTTSTISPLSPLGTPWQCAVYITIARALGSSLPFGQVHGSDDVSRFPGKMYGHSRVASTLGNKAVVQPFGAGISDWFLTSRVQHPRCFSFAQSSDSAQHRLSRLQHTDTDLPRTTLPINSVALAPRVNMHGV